MTLRHKHKGVENLRLANLRDYIITEEVADVSPRTTHPTRRSRALPRRINVNDDTIDDIMASFRRFTWETPEVDGMVLCNYRRFVNAMIVPTREAIEPWVEWVEIQLGWEREWILENPVTTKREIMRRFEGDDSIDNESAAVDMWDPRRLIRDEQDPRPQHSDEHRRGALSGIGFREEEREGNRDHTRSTLRLRRFRQPDRPKTSLGHRNVDESNATSTKVTNTRKMKRPERPSSALGFRDIGAFKRQIVSLKKKALTNPWQKRKKDIKEGGE